MTTAALCPRCLRMMLPTLHTGVYRCALCSKHFRIDASSDGTSTPVEVELVDGGFVAKVSGRW